MQLMGGHVLLSLSGRHCSFTFLLLAQTTSASGWQVSPGSSKIDLKFLFLVLLRGDKFKRRKGDEASGPYVTILKAKL